LKNRLNTLNSKAKRTVVGIETGNAPGRLGAAVVEVSGQGDATVLYLKGFQSYTLPAELAATLRAFEGGGKLDSEEKAGVNFLVLHHISNLYQELIDESGIALDEIDLIGLKCLEAGGEAFPTDPAVLSEMTGVIVASRFYIGVEGRDGEFLPVKESLLRGMVGDMIERYGLESEVREAVAVALLANESLFHERSEMCERRGTRPTVKSAKIAGGDSQAHLCGEFFFPA
jgi:1,6-anhydro-N-acetylmuramate kinase